MSAPRALRPKDMGRIGHALALLAHLCPPTVRGRADAVEMRVLAGWFLTEAEAQRGCQLLLGPVEWPEWLGQPAPEAGPSGEGVQTWRWPEL